MIAMQLKDGVKSYLTPHITKETKSAVPTSFQFEDGTLTYTLEAPVIDGKVIAVDINDPVAVGACKVKSVRQSAGNDNVKISQSFSKLASTATEGFKRLMDHANTLAAPASGN